MAGETTQNKINRVRSLLGSETIKFSRIMASSQEVSKTEIYDPDDMQVIKDHRKLFDQAVQAYNEASVNLEPRLRIKNLDVATLEPNMKKVLAQVEEVSSAVGVARDAFYAKKLVEDKAKAKEQEVKDEQVQELVKGDGGGAKRGVQGT